MLPTGFRVVTLCGSLRPAYRDSNDDYNQIMSAAFRDRGIVVHPVDIGDWRLSQAPRLLQEVRLAQPDAIVMQYPTDAFGRSFTPQVFSMFQNVAPMVVTLHEFSFSHVLRRLAIGPLLMRASVVAMTAERERKSILQWYPWLRKRTHVIPSGSNMPPRRWNPSPIPEIVYFGQIRPRKGIEEFIACRDLLARSRPEIKFKIIGSIVPKFRLYFDIIVAAADDHSIEFSTDLEGDEVSDQLASAWAALLPFPDGASFRRGSLLAAAGCGTPIVSRNGPGTPPEMASILSLGSDVDDLATMITKLVDDPATRQMSHEQSLHVADMAGWPMIIDRYINIFESFRRR
jgi:glycosyltransferase involved in cell wall biosynthesis